MKATMYTDNAGKKKETALPDELFGLPWNADLVHQVVTSMQANARTPVAHAKDRSEVRGGGAKPWRQKGTGRARHGSTRSPIWVGGGVAHGPLKEKSYTKKINKKMKVKALLVALSEKARAGDVLFTDSLKASGKTKEAKGFIEALQKTSEHAEVSKSRGKRTLLVLPEKNELIERSFANVASVAIADIQNISALDVLTYSVIVFLDAEKSVEGLRTRAKNLLK